MILKAEVEITEILSPYYKDGEYVQRREEKRMERIVACCPEGSGKLGKEYAIRLAVRTKQWAKIAAEKDKPSHHISNWKVFIKSIQTEELE